MTTKLRSAWLAAAFVMWVAAPVFMHAQALPTDEPEKTAKRGDILERAPTFDEQVRDLRFALARLPPTTLFVLKVKTADPAALKPKLDALLKRYHFPYELRGTTKEELLYEVRTPAGAKTERLSDRIQKLDPANATDVEWEEKKEKK